MTIQQVSREVGLNKNTVGELFCFLREMCGCVVFKSGTPVGGVDKDGNAIVVEIDESKFGRCKYHRGHPVEGIHMWQYMTK